MAGLSDLSDWLDAQSHRDTVWYVKRLSANDTLASGAHQAGPYMPKAFLFDMLPSLNRPDAENPDTGFEMRIDNHGDVRQIRAVWYNNKLRGGTRNETRLTGFGGGASALLNPESTGALAVFAFHRNTAGEARVCHAWVCDCEEEEDLVEGRIGSVEPGQYRIWSVNQSECEMTVPTSRASCWLEPDEIPELWRTGFPKCEEIIEKAIELCPDRGESADMRLIRRRDCEFEVFLSLEENIELPLIRQGFDNFGEFVSKAQTILQRRKARAGLSLELHARRIFLEERLREGQDFSHQPESDPGRRPDFLFPSQSAYQDHAFPSSCLRMLAVKTTCRDRWRQILNEADRVKLKHLLTLQEGVSERQFDEMKNAGVQLVVPEPLVPSYPSKVQPHLQTLGCFIKDLRLLKGVS